MKVFKLAYNKKKRNRGFLLIELTAAAVVLLIVANFALLSAQSLILTHNWTIIQTMTDAFMTSESARGRRILWSNIPTNYPMGANNSVSTQINVGTTPNGLVVTGTLFRYSQITSIGLTGANTLPNPTVNPTTNANVGGITAMTLYSVLNYQIGGRNYVKTIQTIRTQ